MKTVLLIYNKSKWSYYKYDFEKYLRKHFDKVLTLDLNKTPYWTNWNNRLPFYVPKGIPESVNSINEPINLCIEIDGAGQYHFTGLKNKPYKKILWSMDTHTEEKRKFHQYFQDDYDLVLTAHKNCIGYFKNSKWLPFFCEPEIHKPIELKKKYDVIFVGNITPEIYPQRVRLLNKLSQHFNVGIFSKVYSHDMINLFNQSDIIFNKSYNGDLNFRVFEALACKKLLITDRINNGLFNLFEERKHLVTYDNYIDLKEKISFYLNNRNEREKIANCGYEEVIKRHTLEHRIKEIVS